MALPYMSPGVYIKEEDRGPKPIQALGTSMAAFIGITRDATIKKINPDTQQKEIVENCLNNPTLVTSWTQFVDIFGDFADGIYLPDAVYGYFANGGGPCYVTSLRLYDKSFELTKTAQVPASADQTSGSTTQNDPSKKGKGAKGSADADSAGTPTDQSQSAGSGDDKPGTGAAAASTDSTPQTSVDTINDVKVDKAKQGLPGKVKPLDQKDVIGDAEKRSGLAGLKALDNVRLVLCPDIMAGYDGTSMAKERVKIIQEAIVTHCREMRYQFAILDTPPDLSAAEVLKWRGEYLNLDQKAANYAAVYYPWIKVADLSGSGRLSKPVPPSGHIAGIYNRSDAERGVHKAPANEGVLGAVGLDISLSRAEQDSLNPIGVNCIRPFPGRGIRVWGARTLASGSGEVTWQYINVRRLFIMVESSIENSLQWVVFEPNDTNLWARVTRDITEFLRNVWRSGALFGTTPSQAFYVKCDEELNPRELRDLGQLHIEIGLAPTKPAEFVVIHITQWAGPDAEAS